MCDTGIDCSKCNGQGMLFPDGAPSEGERCWMCDGTGQLPVRPALHCEMRATCTEPVTHLDEKGFVYCTDHGIARRGSGRLCRKLRPAELKRLQRGETLTRY